MQFRHTATWQWENMNTIYRKVLVRPRSSAKQEQVQLTPLMKVWGKEGRTEVFSGPVQKHLTSFRAQEGKSFLQIHFPRSGLGCPPVPQAPEFTIPSPLGLCFWEFSADVTNTNLPLLWVRRAHCHPWCTDLGRPPQAPLPAAMPSCLQIVSGMVYWAFRAQGNPTPESWINVELRDEKSSSNLRPAPKTAWLLTEVILSH